MKEEGACCNLGLLSLASECNQGAVKAPSRCKQVSKCGWVDHSFKCDLRNSSAARTAASCASASANAALLGATTLATLRMGAGREVAGFVNLRDCGQF